MNTCNCLYQHPSPEWYSCKSWWNFIGTLLSSLTYNLYLSSFNIVLSVQQKYNDVISYHGFIFCCCEQWMRKTFILAQNSRLWLITSESSQQQDLDTICPIVSVIRTESNVCVCVYTFIQLESPCFSSPPKE